jgi:hypothetical protein
LNIWRTKKVLLQVPPARGTDAHIERLYAWHPTTQQLIALDTHNRLIVYKEAEVRFVP